MFDLNRELRRWRRSVSRHGALGRDELDELESHLLEAFEALTRAGASPAEAFSSAESGIGDPKILSGEYEKSRRPSTRRMWRAFWVAPAVAPILMAIEIFIVGMVFSDPKDPGTPIGIILLPLMLLSLGMVFSYAIAALVWMPIVFHLRELHRLSAGTIHAAASLLAVACFALLEAAAYAVTTPKPTDLLGFVASSLPIAAILLPNILVSAAVFWMMIREPATPPTTLEAA
mgnify:CR=1 FL=1